MALAAIRDALIATPQSSPRPDDGLVQALLENLARGQFCEILSYSNFCLFEFQQFNSLIRPSAVTQIRPIVVTSKPANRK